MTTDTLGVLAMGVTLGSFGIIAWIKYREEKRRSNKLSTDNMRLTMENYNLNLRLSQAPQKGDDKCVSKLF